MVRGLLLLLALGIAGCSSMPPEANVARLLATDPPVISWTPAEARSVDVRHERSGRVVWRVVAGGGPRGLDPVRSPLTYGDASRPATAFPPDNAGTQSQIGPEPLRPDARYRVTIDRCLHSASSALNPSPCELVVAFTTSNTHPMAP